MTQASGISAKGHTLLWSHRIKLQSNSLLSLTNFVWLCFLKGKLYTLDHLYFTFAVTMKGQELNNFHQFLLLCKQAKVLEAVL